MSKNSTENSIFFNLLNTNTTSILDDPSESNESLDLDFGGNLDHVLNTFFGGNDDDHFEDRDTFNTG